MDAVSYSHADKQKQRIEKFIEQPDSTSGVVTVPKVIGAGENITVPAGRVAVLPNVQVDGTLNVEGEVFIPSGSSVDFSTGIKVNGEKLTMSIPTAYHIYNGSVEATNTILTNGFSTTLYTGNGTTQSITTGVDMDTQWGNDASEKFGGLVWIKSRSNTNFHNLQDTIRGTGKRLVTNTTDSEFSVSTCITSFNSNGFTTGSAGDTNGISLNYTSWNFQTTHRISGTTNHGKAYTCHYNPFTGFTIVKYVGSGIAGHEIPHHLGRKLGFWVSKNLTSTTYGNWHVGDYNEDGKIVYLNTTFADTADSNNTISTDAFVRTNTGHEVLGANGQSIIIYGWANSYFDEANKLIGNYEIGVYQGTGAAGNKVTTRGKPAWVMIKRLDGIGNWAMYDNKRGLGVFICANLSNAEESSQSLGTFNSDGFTINNTVWSDLNASGGQYIYMVVYDNDSDSGKSKYPKATDTTNLSINALVPYANGIDVNGSKVSIEYKNETITGLTLTQGKNYIYSKNDGTYGVSKYAPCYGLVPTRTKAGETPDFFDIAKNKWYTTTGGAELVTNGTFSNGTTTGWTAKNNATVSVVNGTVQISYNNVAEPLIEQAISTVVGKNYRVNFNVSGTYGMVVVGSGNASTFNGEIAVGRSSFTFTATGTTTYIKLVTNAGGAATSNFDNISVFEAEPTIGTEITPRNYLDCVVYADHNGQVSYVEELPKTTYFDEVKANEFKGKNACTAWVNFDGTTTPPTIRDSYNVSSVVRVSTGQFEVYFGEPMDNTKYTIIDSSSSGGTSLIGATEVYNNSKLLNKFHFITFNTTDAVASANNINILIFGGKN